MHAVPLPSPLALPKGTSLRLSGTLTTLFLLPLLALGSAVFADTPGATPEGDKLDGTASTETPPTRKAAVKTPSPSAKPGATVKKAKGVYRLPIPPKDFSPPALSISEPVYEWGSVVQGTVVKHTFKVRNTGGSPLIIDNVKPQCGCTAVEKPTEPIAPGEFADLTLSVDTKRFKGTMKKTARINSNATTATFVVTMQGSVEQVFGTEPQHPKIEVVRGSEVPSGKITFRRLTEKPARILEVTTSSTVIKPTLKEIEPENLYEVDIDVELNTNKRNYFYENMTIKVEANGEVIDLPVRVTIIVKDRIDVSPKSAYFPRKDTDTLKVPNAPALTKELNIKSLAGSEHSFRITEIVNPGNNFTTELETVEEGRHYKLIVSLPKLPAKQSRTVRDRLIIKTDDPNQTELKVTAMGIFSSGAAIRRTTRSSAQTKKLQLPRPPTTKPAAATGTAPPAPPK